MKFFIISKIHELKLKVSTEDEETKKSEEAKYSSGYNTSSDDLEMIFMIIVLKYESIDQI